MENHRTLFGHLVSQFATHPENLATESLLYLLQNSKSTNGIFTDYIKNNALNFPTPSYFDSQVSTENSSIPDMVGWDETGAKIIIVENKFWAELTPNQPIGYLSLLSNKVQGALVFICPQKRLNVLNNELQRLINEDQNQYEYQNIIKSDDLISNKVTKQQFILIVSWRRVINDLEKLLDPVKERNILNDLQQLRGLCEQMDVEGFIPLRPNETSNLEIPRRALNYLDVIEEICTSLVEKGIASKEGLSVSANRERPGRYINIRERDEFGCLLAMDYQAWKEFGLSPIWLEFNYTDWGKGAKVNQILNQFNKELFKFDDRVCIPINLISNSDLHHVVANAVQQISDIADMICKNPN